LRVGGDNVRAFLHRRRGGRRAARDAQSCVLSRRADHSPQVHLSPHLHGLQVQLLVGSFVIAPSLQRPLIPGPGTGGRYADGLRAEQGRGADNGVDPSGRRWMTTGAASTQWSRSAVGVSRPRNRAGAGPAGRRPGPGPRSASEGATATAATPTTMPAGGNETSGVPSGFERWPVRTSDFASAQGSPARSNSSCRRGRRRWVCRSSATRSSTSPTIAVPAASWRMVRSRRAAIW
jgi:hypothetical protein